MKSKSQIKHKQRGFTLMEAIVGMAIFGILAVGMIQLYGILTRVVKLNRQRTILTNLANQKLEIGRNLPYSQIGTVNGNPNGSLADFSNPDSVTIENVIYHIYYEVTYIDDPADGTILAGTDAAPNDYKQLKMFVENTSTSQITNFLTNISPKSLEGLISAGALVIKVFNAQGQPLADADVHIENTAGTIILDRQTDSAGNLIEVGLPAAVNGYNITTTKTGYSTDATYPITAGNPSPTKPNPTISVGSVTQVSFSIDALSNLAIRTLNQACGNLNNVNLNVAGGKLIGTSPNVYKFNNNYGSAAGLINLTDIEWDNYTPTLLTGQSVMVYGTSPIQNINILPGTSQQFSLILGPKTANSLLVIVKDASTTVSLEGATVTMTNGGADNDAQITGGSVWSQTDWSGGSGQSDFTLANKYFSDDGFVNVSTLPTGVRLLNSGGYVPTGTLHSSTFDTGTSSTTYTTLNWLPASQNPQTTLKFQVASNNDNATWNYVGPDGTAATFYTTPGSSISAAHDGDRYIRYKAMLATSNTSVTPVLTSMEINYVSGCFTPGQVMFPGLAGGNNYSVTVNAPGYTAYSASNLNVSGNQTLEVLLSP